MKKIFATIIVITMCFSLCSCVVKSPEDELAEAIKEYEQSKQFADAAKDNYDALQEAIKDYEEAVEKVQGAK
ncbi:MAG: hypothetical protein IJ306_03330 [Oscillospiraceae bacterium]|nr:hypothetical protein [Oscillospiraceae bacterium]